MMISASTRILRAAGRISAQDIANGNRRMLAKAITLAESQNPEHATELGDLLRDLDRHKASVGHKIAPRIALSGSPGAGKSSLIESLGHFLCEKKGLKVGVLAVDPSSSVTKGSILGDKTRMEKLSSHPNAFIRPSPSCCHLGGVTAHGWEVLEILESAAFDVLLVETVGVGQSETQVKDLTDLMLLLVPPASGDELQGIKKGIVEVSDIVVVTKYDGDKKELAKQTVQAYARAVMYRREQNIDKPVVPVSAEAGTNIEKLWEITENVWNERNKNGGIESLRRRQAAKHFLNYFQMELQLRAEQMCEAERNTLGGQVWRRELTPREAGDALIQRVLRSKIDGTHG